MSLWKITDKGPLKVDQTVLKKEKILEEKLEEWILKDPTILGEKLLIIGRQIIIPEIKDRLDILALDQLGNTVIIELKRGHLKDPVDIQALRYASYLAKWQFDNFETQARNFISKGDDDFNFNSVFESFCEESGAEEIPDINVDQRIIIVGTSVRERLGSVALWLRDHSVDIKIIEINTYKDNNNLIIQPNVIIPLQVNRFEKVGIRKSGGTEPWLKDGKTWHLEKRCSKDTREIYLLIEKILLENFEFDGPHFNQKHYIAFKRNNYNWLLIITSPKALILQFLVKAGSFDADTLAKELGVVKFDKEESLSEKLNLPSSVLVINKNEYTDRIRLRVKEDFDINASSFLEFLMESYKAFHK